MLRVRYQTFEFGEIDIHLCCLRDRQQYEDDEGIADKLGISSATWPFFGVVWDSSAVLAHLMFDYAIDGKRILEVGCGMALSSLVLNHRHADISATDYHPVAEQFLDKNTALNHGDPIPFTRTGWQEGDSGMGLFDLIIGSDLLYERGHAEQLAAFIEQHAKAQCEVVVVDPGRGNQNRFSRRMVAFGYHHSQRVPQNTHYLAKPFKGLILNYLR